MTAPKCPGLAAGAVSLRKSHDIVILSFCNKVKGLARLAKFCTKTMTEVKIPRCPMIQRY